MNLPFFISGDWPFFFAEQIKSLPWVPSGYWSGSNFGQNAVARLWLDYPFRMLVKFLSIPWVIMEKLLLLSIIILAFWSMYQFSGRYVKERWARLASSFIYLGNTYFFLVLGGGQLGVAAAYAFFPYALLSFIKLIESRSFKQSVATGVSFGILMALDLRFAYLLVLAFAVYCLVHFKVALTAVTYIFGSFVVAGTLHFYWILPMALWGLSMPHSATGVGSLSFFSVADFSHAFTLLHPNWPENLFGKVYFQQPEFLVLPILAFVSLLFIKKREVLFFPILALIGIFLAKGVNPPGGELYEFFFRYIPGFFMFRDPTKFYVFIALGYSILIPITLDSIIRGPLAVLRGVPLQKIVIGIFIVLELFLFRDVFLGKTTHSFQFQSIPNEYQIFKDVLRADNRFSRVLWLPDVPHFAYSDDTHPFVDAAHIPGAYTQEVLSEKSIGYIVVSTKKQTLVYSLADSGLPRMGQFADLAVFRNPGALDLFSLPWHKNGVSKYSVTIPRGEQSLTMRLAFDAGWRLAAAGQVVEPIQTAQGWMQFALPAGSTNALVYFAPDSIAKIGAVISGLLFILYIWIL